MDATECFENHQTCILNELIQPDDDEEIVDDHRLAFVQFETGTFKIKVHVQMLKEFSDWITIGVRFLLNDFDQILECVATARIDDDGGGQIAQNVRRCRLNGIQVQWFVQKHFNHQIASFRMIDEHKHAPVNQPGALLQCFDVAEIEKKIFHFQFRRQST